MGNLIQELLKLWMLNQGITYEENPNSQKNPDFYLDPDNKKSNLL